jgi:hypothetical protein
MRKKYRCTECRAACKISTIDNTKPLFCLYDPTTDPEWKDVTKYKVSCRYCNNLFAEDGKTYCGIKRIPDIVNIGLVALQEVSLDFACGSFQESSYPF